MEDKKTDNTHDKELHGKDEHTFPQMPEQLVRPSESGKPVPEKESAKNSK